MHRRPACATRSNDPRRPSAPRPSPGTCTAGLRFRRVTPPAPQSLNHNSCQYVALFRPPGPAPPGASGTGTPRAAPKPASSPASARSPSARAPAPRHPRKRPLHHPAAARDRESPCFPGPLHDLDEGSEAALRQRLPGLRTRAAAVRPGLPHLGRLPGIARTASGAPSLSCTSAPAAPGARPGPPRRPPPGAASAPWPSCPRRNPTARPSPSSSPGASWP